MPRILLALVALLSLSVTASAVRAAPISLGAVFVQLPTHERLFLSLGVRRPRGPTPPAQSCCKICSVGKACGNTCISRDKTCHVGPGCACDG